jgi:hypothetical protein
MSEEAKSESNPSTNNTFFVLRPQIMWTTEKVWRDEPLTFFYTSSLLMGHENNGHRL